MSNYDINDIESLSFKEGVRRRVQMYLGSDDNEGTYQALKEIINNSTDEALAGYGKKIEITVDLDTNAVSVRDYGRGVPFGTREDGENVLVSIYSKSHTGGKFNNNVYKNSSGLNGIGAKCVCLSAEHFEVQSWRDGKTACACFEKGELKDYRESYSIRDKGRDGTYVRFNPDPEVFKNGEIGYDYERICQEIHDIAFLYTGVAFIVTCIMDGKVQDEQTYLAKNGIVDFVKEKISTPLHKHIITATAEDANDSLEIAFQWGKGKEESYVFVNGLRCPEGGSPVTGAKSAITKTFNSLAEGSFDGDRIRDGLFYVINCKVANPSFANQTKSKINNANLRTLASNAFSNALKQMKEQYGNEFTTISDLMKKMANADAAAEKARQAILNHEKKEAAYKKKKVSSSEKFKDCEKHGEDSILIICEGNSALNGLMPARNVDNEALYAIRGKIINLLKHPLEECLENQEVSDIIAALGCGILDKYNPKKLNYGRVAIASDADVDGKNIGCLLATMFYVLMPQFIQEGRLCWLQAPLFKLEKGGKRVFAYTQEELESIKQKYPGWEQTRNKGLGEMSSEDMKQSMLHPENRHLEILTIDDYDSFSDSIEMLMGNKVDTRREFLFDNVDFSVLNR